MIFFQNSNLSHKPEKLLAILCWKSCVQKMWILIKNNTYLLDLCINSYLSCLKASAFTSGVSTECSNSAPSGPVKKKKTKRRKITVQM